MTHTVSRWFPLGCQLDTSSSYAGRDRCRMDLIGIEWKVLKRLNQVYFTIKSLETLTQGLELTKRPVLDRIFHDHQCPGVVLESVALWVSTLAIRTWEWAMTTLTDGLDSVCQLLISLFSFIASFSYHLRPRDSRSK